MEREASRCMGGEIGEVGDGMEPGGLGLRKRAYPPLPQAGYVGLDLYIEVWDSHYLHITESESKFIN